MRESSQYLHKILLFLFYIFLIRACIYRVNINDLVDYSRECLSKFDIINTGVQRLSKLELEGNHSDELITDINYIVCYELFSDDDVDRPYYFETNNEMLMILRNIFADWKIFYNCILDFRDSGNRDDFFKVSEEEYIKMSAYSVVLRKYIDIYARNVFITNCYIVFNLFIIVLVFLKYLSGIIIELKKNKELSKDMFIDTSTGLYNSSKCQEILNGTSIEQNQAIIVCDLNGLKKTNDDFGHRAGDELIYCFARELKKATSVFESEVFVGRYGGDEFLIFVDNIEEIYIKAYVKEINFLMEQFNETENKLFKLSCAIGYAISSENTGNLTKKDLFDIADDNMYKNKTAMKNAK